MTAIVGLVDKERVYIAGDSAGVSAAALSITVRDDVKVFKRHEFIIGGSGSFRMIQILRFRFDPPKQVMGQSDYEYMCTDFIDACRKCFSDNGFGDKDATKGGHFLVGYKGVLYTIDSDHQVGIVKCQYDACGCGDEYAKGSLFTSVGKPPKERLRLALEAAANFSAGVCGPFVFEEEAEVKAEVKSNKKKK